jgi:hypothetical protein
MTEMSPHDLSGLRDRRAGLAAALKQEAAAISGGREFRRAPVLSRLFKFLVEATLDGSAARLKAYTVAVDALGRPESFDAQSDSYVRVQMGRLRKLIERHYTDHAPTDGLAIQFEPGSFRVRLARAETAYPHLFRSAEAPASAEPTAVAVPAERPPPPEPSPRRGWSMVGIAAVATLVAVAIMGLLLFQWRGGLGLPGSASGPVSPVVSVHATSGDSTAGTARAEVETALVDGLRRSWVVRVAQGGGVNANGQTDYRLDALITRQPTGNRVALKLVHLPEGTTLWSATMPLKSGDASKTLSPAIARIAGPSGAVASAERDQTGAQVRGSYACMLSYIVHIQTREPDLRAGLDRCFAGPVTEPQLRAPVLAARSFYTLETATPATREWALTQAERLAQQSIQADPESAFAQFAMARISYFRDDCTAGNHHTRLAVAANPHDPMILAILAGLSHQCGFADARALLDRAFRIRDEGDLYVRGFLAFASISHGETGRLATLGLSVRPPPGPLLSRYLLIETLVASVQNRPVDARRTWREFRQGQPNLGATDAEALSTIVLSPRLRAQVLTLMADRGVIEKPE